MANSFIVYPNETGSTRDYSVPFEYLSTEFVKATVDGAPVPFSFLSTYMIRFNTAPAGVLKIYRETKRGDLINTYINGSILVDDQLNTSFWQSLHISEEVFDSSLKLNETGSWDAENLRLVDLPAPVDAKDAVNKSYLDQRFAADKQEVDQNRQLAQAAAASATASKNAAATSESNAAASASAASASESAAAGSESSAAASASSALSSKNAAAASASASASSASAAAASESNAAASESAAASSASAASVSESNSSVSETNAAASASAAASSEASAASSASAALSHKNNAAASASSAASSEDKAQKWAEEAEDTPVEPGAFSAKHWAAKAQAFAQGDAINVTVSPSGGISSTNVQAALEELSAEKADTVSLGSAAYAAVSSFLAAGAKAVDSDKVDGYHASAGADANTAAVRNGSGYLYATIFNQTYSATNSDIHRILTQNSSDGFLRPSTPAQVAAAIAPHLSLGNDVYTGSDVNQTSFPVGHLVGAEKNGSHPNRNASQVVRLHPSSAVGYHLGNDGAALAGTWRSRGRTSHYSQQWLFFLMQRTA